MKSRLIKSSREEIPIRPSVAARGGGAAVDMKTSNYEPGSLFSLPLERGGYGVALIASWTADRPLGKRAVFVYGFDRIFEKPPVLEDAIGFAPFDAVHLQSNIDECLSTKEWTVLGKHPAFSPAVWPKPGFIYDHRVGTATWNQAWRAQKKTPPPWPKGDENISWQSVPNTWGSVLVDARKYISEHKFECFPPRLGLGIGGALEASLDYAVRDRNELYYTKVTPEAMKVWERVRAALVKEGLVQGDMPAKEKAVARKKTTKKKK